MHHAYATRSKNASFAASSNNLKILMWNEFTVYVAKMNISICELRNLDCKFSNCTFEEEQEAYFSPRQRKNGNIVLNQVYENSSIFILVYLGRSSL